MQGFIQKWGNSLGLRIPKQLAKRLKLHQGSAITLEIDHNRLIIQAPECNLEDMLKEITPHNQHHLLLDDEQIGNEEW